MGFLARFVPSLLPGLGMLANPWVLLAMLAGAVGLVLFGLHLGTAQLHAFQAQVDAAGKIQEAATRARIVVQKKITEENDHDHIEADRALARAYAGAFTAGLLHGAGGGVLPAISAAAGGGDETRQCFDRAELARGLDAADAILQAGALRSLRRGDQARSDLKLAVDWTLRQAKP
jgi:hypothetical protein